MPLRVTSLSATIPNHPIKPTKSMKNISHLPESEQQHFMKCNGCGDYLDMRDLGQVFEHEHDDNLPKVDGSKYNSKKVGDNVEYIGGKDPVNLN